MKHRINKNNLSRKASHRKSMLSNMACSLIISDKKRIFTTLAKAKSLRQYIEPIMTKSKLDNTQSRRLIFSYIKNKKAVYELFFYIAPKILYRNGGYTRIIKTGYRLGDGAKTALIELVDFNNTYKK